MKKVAASVGMMGCLLVLTLGASYISWNTPEKEQKKSKPEVVEWSEPDQEYLDFYGLGTFETTLPVIYIDTKETRVTKENKSWASIAVLNAEEDGSAHSVMEQPDESFSITINYRGASSYSQFDKKQYRIKFYKKEGSSKAKDYEFLGMGANSEWVLNGPFLDKTLMRNHLFYDIGREILEWAPDSRYVEVFVDGEYKGVYLAVEPVTNGASRLRLSEFGLLTGATSYMVKRDRIGTEENPLNTYGKEIGATYNELYIGYPSQKKLTEPQREWIEQDINRVEKVLYGENFADPKTGYAAYIDVDSFVNYYILNEVAMIEDAGNLSTYIYKELGGKLQITVWDFNNGYDNYQWFAQDYEEFFAQDNSWFSRLLQDRSFVDCVVARYRELRQDIFTEEYFFSLLDSYEQILGEAIERNFAVWGYTFSMDLLSDVVNEQGEIITRDPQSYEEAVVQLRTAIQKRFAFLDEHIEDLYEGCVN